MILPEVIISSKINLKLSESGMDSAIRCKDKEWFKTFPHPVSYNYNSRGFRDNEWPEDLKNAIWCIGDSFTVGIGSPIEHTWPYLLGKEMQRQTINISLDGASNDFIARMSCIIKKEINPYAIVHQWSYTHRRELAGYIPSWFVNSTVEEDMENFIKNIKSTAHDNSIHSFVPAFEPDGNHAKNKVKEEMIPNVVFDNEHIDYARDYHHYDIVTAKRYVEYYKEFFANFK